MCDNTSSAMIDPADRSTLGSVGFLPTSFRNPVSAGSDPSGPGGRIYHLRVVVCLHCCSCRDTGCSCLLVRRSRIGSVSFLSLMTMSMAMDVKSPNIHPLASNIVSLRLLVWFVCQGFIIVRTQSNVEGCQVSIHHTTMFRLDTVERRCSLSHRFGTVPSYVYQRSFFCCCFYYCCFFVASSHF